MEPFEVLPKLEHLEANPYRALVSCNAGNDQCDDFSGEVRLTPEATLHDDMLDFLSGDVCVTMRNYLSGEGATILRFYVDDGPDDGDRFNRTKEQRLIYTVNSLIHELGRLSNAELFLQPNADKTVFKIHL